MLVEWYLRTNHEVELTTLYAYQIYLNEERNNRASALWSETGKLCSFFKYCVENRRKDPMTSSGTFPRWITL